MTGKKGRKSKALEVFTKDNPLHAGDLKLFVGAKLEALDSRRWYQARIVKIDPVRYRVLVHFEGWNSRHDKWFDHTSESLRSTSPHEGNQGDSSMQRDLQAGDRVLARWSDSKFYPAKVHSSINEKTYDVIFFDGFKKRLNISSIRPDPKRTFEAFEEQFKSPPHEPQPTAASTPQEEDKINEPSASSSGSRAKRRHTEPSTMTDFVRTLPGKRPKYYYFGMQSDSDDLPLSHMMWHHGTKEEEIESQGSSSSGVKRVSALCKEKRLGYPDDSAFPLSPPGIKKSDISSPKKSSKELVSSSNESFSSSKDLDTSGGLESEPLSPSPKYGKKNLGGILKVKLPMQSRRKKRGRKKILSKFRDVSPSDSVGSRVAVETSDKVSKLEQSDSRKDEDGDGTHQDEYRKASSDKHHQSSESVSKCASESFLDKDGSLMCKADSSSSDALPETTQERAGLSTLQKDTPLSVGRVQKKRGRKPGKLNSAKNSTSNPKILPKRERKLTEKGLELLQIIGHKKGNDFFLKEAFGSLEGSDNHRGKNDHSPIQMQTDTSLQEKPCIGESQNLNIPSESGKNEAEDTNSISRVKTEIPAEKNSDMKINAESSCFDEVEQLNEEKDYASQPGFTDHNMKKLKDDEMYSDSYSEGSGDLVIDIEDELKEARHKKIHSNVEKRTFLKKKRSDAFSSGMVENSMASKQRAYPRLKYTLSNEEKRGSRLAKLKKNRMKKRLEGKLRKDGDKGGVKTENDSVEKRSVGKNPAENSQSSINVSPLESLTRMVSETSQPVGSTVEDKVISLKEGIVSAASNEETAKPAKSSKPHRGPYKPRMRIKDNFLSMVEQERPSQIERPLSDDLIKAKSNRGRSRNRFLNCADDEKSLETNNQKRDDVQAGLNEPLEFSSPLKDMRTIDLNKIEVSSLVYPRPSHIGSFAGPHNAIIGTMPRCLSPQHLDRMRNISPSLHSSSSGYDQRPHSAPHVMPYQGMPDERVPMAEYGVNLLPVMNMTSKVPMNYASTCVRMQGMGEDCPCIKCRERTSRAMEAVNEKAKVHQDLGSKQGMSLDRKDPQQIQTDERLSDTTNKEKKSISDQELIITDVFSLRDPSRIDLNKRCTVDVDDVKAKNSEEGNETDRLDVVMNSPDEVKEVSSESLEGQQVTPKPKEFESKKKRLDLITGKLSAQKRVSPIVGVDGGKSTEKGDAEDQPEISSPDPSPPNQLSQEPSLHGKESVLADGQHLISPPMDYMYSQTTYIPVMNPHFDPLVGFPSSSLEVPPPRIVPPDVPMVPPHHQVHMDPRAYFPNPEFAQPIRPLYDAEGLPPPGYQTAIHGIPYMPPEMLNHPRFHQMPAYPYGSPRFMPAPRYFLPREPLSFATTRAPPPYGSFPMTSSGQRFRYIAPNGRIPLVVCKQANCNCHLPHAAPPIQILPQHMQTSQASNNTSEDEKSKVTQSAKKNEPMMKGDPRRLTLPLQRMRKVDMKSSDEDISSSSMKQINSASKQLAYDGTKEGDTDLAMIGNNDKEREGFGSADNMEGIESGREDATELRNKIGSAKKSEKGHKREHVLAPREFVVELDLNEFQCKFKGCKKSFRKATSRDNHQRYFHSPRVPQRKRKPSSTSVLSPISGDPLLSPASFAQVHLKVDSKASSEDVTSIRSGYSSSVVTDDNISDREKHVESSSDEFEDSDLDSNGSVCVDDIIRCKCGDLEEQGFMIQCEQCYTWQHGDCVNLTMQTVPKNYLCYICTNPEGLRSSFRYKNNHEWYKRGTLPSLVPMEDENQERIAELIQASHALMEDIANVFDVIAGMKKKIRLLNEPSHPALKFWSRDGENGEANDKCIDNTTEKLDRGESNSVADNVVKSDILGVENQKANERNDEEETNRHLLNGNSASKDENVKHASKTEGIPTDKKINPTLDNPSAAEDVTTENDVLKLEKDSATSVNVTASVDRCIRADVTEGEASAKRESDEECKKEPAPVDTTEENRACISAGLEKRDPKQSDNVPNMKEETDALNVVYTKLRLQDHLDSIEDELNRRMDEIETNLDVLEKKYHESEVKAKGDCRSAFRIALPDMTSIGRHLNMINRQLIDPR